MWMFRDNAFSLQRPFNKPIGNWDTSSVTIFRLCFITLRPSINIGDWDTSSATGHRQHGKHPSGMLQIYGLQPLINKLKWDISAVTNMTNMFNAPTTSPTPTKALFTPPSHLILIGHTTGQNLSCLI